METQVPLISTDLYYKEQNPEVNVSPQVSEEWKNWKFK